jgi:hypothetical protein
LSSELFIKFLARWLHYNNHNLYLTPFSGYQEDRLVIELCLDKRGTICDYATHLFYLLLYMSRKKRKSSESTDTPISTNKVILAPETTVDAEKDIRTEEAVTTQQDTRKSLWQTLKDSVKPGYLILALAGVTAGEGAISCQYAKAYKEARDQSAGLAIQGTNYAIIATLNALVNGLNLQDTDDNAGKYIVSSCTDLDKAIEFRTQELSSIAAGGMCPVNIGNAKRLDGAIVDICEQVGAGGDIRRNEEITRALILKIDEKCFPDKPRIVFPSAAKSGGSVDL